jgi:RHS repeat-associated protein
VATNRINTAGFQYNAAGNQTRIVRADGSAQKFQYDAANRLVNIRTDANVIVATYTYGNSNERLIADEGGVRTYYASNGGIALAEYTESGSSTTPLWSKSYIYLGARLLSTLEPNGSGAETVHHHHPDSLGTRLVTNPSDGSYFEQVSLPFGTALSAESTGSTNRRFTSYERSSATGLDYAINRHYDPQQGRFTQVDPIGMNSTNLENPQTLNLYAYCANDPVNNTDPGGLGFFSFLKKLFMFWAFGLLSFKSVRHAVVRAIHIVAQVAGRILNNRWVRIGIFIASFLVPFLPALEAALDIFNTISDIVQTLQRSDMLLQHKYKEFWVSVAIGLASSAISTIADEVVRHVRAYLKGGFRFKDLFNGAWDGLKQGFADVFGRGFLESLVPVYGRYCAPGLGIGAGEHASPVSGIDAKCQTHDGKYDDSKNFPPKEKNSYRLGADKVLLRGLFTAVSSVGIGDIVFAGRPSGGNVYRFVAIPSFGGVIAYRRLRGRRLR